MAEYLFSRVIPRADLGWSQVEVCATRLVWSASGGVAIVRSPASAYVKTDPAFLFRHEWHGDLGVLHTFSQYPAGPCRLVEHSIETLCTTTRNGRPASFRLRANPVVTTTANATTW